MIARTPSRVPVIPNASDIRFQVERAAADERGATWDVAVQESGDVPGQPNFARPYVNQTITVHAPPGVKAAAGDVLVARVAFRGDEGGGKFVLVGNARRA